jgi:hypothetical protein
MHFPDDDRDDDNDTPALPCAGGLIAGTLALMTCWAAPEPGATATEEQQRALMARKIASNLYFLREHPDIPPGLRRVIGKVHERWLLLAQALPGTGAQDLARLEALPAAHALH